MKAVLLSIRPEWCDLIIRRQKTLEVRRTSPKLETPFKCYVYCTKSKSKIGWLLIVPGKGWRRLDGNIIGEFTCDKIDKLVHVGTMMDINILTLDGWYKPAGELLQAACLTEAAAKKYLQGRNGYGWHISDLKIYNQPKDIMCFHRAVEENELWCKKCAIGKKKDVHCAFCYGLDGLRLRRPPQSWCYVKELSNG